MLLYWGGVIGGLVVGWGYGSVACYGLGGRIRNYSCSVDEVSVYGSVLNGVAYAAFGGRGMVQPF